ncbi:amidohydrolase [Streptomyces poonensis]|uniref:Peptidase n=1 Tax=Streptomyces poonensis TaxID=68255 RepID=A0A918UFR8_9ACTN|nr:amidohydrolase [Streptomyces poonensis]GGZ02826.1 peptidase [Streptomyces poonensis]GLJ93793.1 peptidase [Streptomyces poonensis]
MTSSSTSSSPLGTVLAGLPGIRDAAEAFYKDLHAHPELGLDEHRTAGRVAERLRHWGYRVTEGIGGTGVVGVLANGEGPTVLFRADMDALPVQEATGLPYASTVTTTGPGGHAQPVMHACGHDMHITCLLGFAALMAEAKDVWQGTVVALFQPSEERGDGADAMLDDGLVDRIPRPDVAFAQHVLPLPAGCVGVRPGPFLSAADNLRITLFGRGAHGSMPQAGIDPVVMAAMCVVRLQTIVSRELAPTTPAALTVGSIVAGTSPNVIPESAVIELNIRTYDDTTRRTVLDAVRRCVDAEAAASGAPKEPLIERLGEFPPTVNDAGVAERLDRAFRAHFGDDAGTIALQTASEDFSKIPDAFGIPFAYWGIGCVDPGTYRTAAGRGTVQQDIPVNHSPAFAPVVQPTLDTGVSALTVAALAWLGGKNT